MRREPERGSRRREEDIGETWPDLPEWATAEELDMEVRRDLRGLSKEGADWVAAHLVAAGALADEEPETAWRHARAARARGGRIGVVRETVGLVAYRAGEWAEAIGELRAARRMGGGPGHLAVMADCERALEHPEKAIELSRSAEADELDPEAATELGIVVAGARADLGQIDAALAHLERIGLDRADEHPRLAYAYADLLLKAGRNQEALSWFIRAADADTDEETDALDRVAALSDEENLDTGSVVASTTGNDEPVTGDDESDSVSSDVAAAGIDTAVIEHGSGGPESGSDKIDSGSDKIDSGSDEIEGGTGEIEGGTGEIEGQSEEFEGHSDESTGDPDDANANDPTISDTGTAVSEESAGMADSMAERGGVPADASAPSDDADGTTPVDSPGGNGALDASLTENETEQDADDAAEESSGSADRTDKAPPAANPVHEAPALLFSDDPQAGDR